MKFEKRGRKGDRGGDVTITREMASFRQARRAPRPIVETGDIISVIDQRVNSRVTAFISRLLERKSDEREFVRATSSPPIPVPAGIASE